MNFIDVLSCVLICQSRLICRQTWIGKLIEEEEGGFAVWLSYLITGVGANLVSWLLLPRSVISAGASGAVFGLFAVSVLVKVVALHILSPSKRNHCI